MSNLEVNKGDQFIAALDISGSMNASDTPGGLSRLKYSLETFKTFASEAAKFDPDGVSLYLFGATLKAFPDLKPDEFSSKLADIKTEGATMTHLAIRAAFDEHIQKKSQQTFLLIFTDGEPSDPDATKQAIIDITKAVKDPLEFRIAFITVGERSPDLEAYLTHLDDTLTSDGAAHDIVDVKRIDEVDFMAAINGALTD